MVTKRHLFWVEGLKAFAILGIILNHFVESFGFVPWFSNPSYNWPDIAARLASIFPAEGTLGWRIVQFLGWLGDMGPGIFILLSGFTLTLSSLDRNGAELKANDFYARRLLRIFPLYLTIHLIIILTGALLNKGPDFTSAKLFMSMLGLRFTDTLFFYINPSWWFIWLIIQLYLVFPWLYRILAKKGLWFFFAVTFGITLLSRGAGLIHLTWSGHLEYWMTGIFAGTRLSEFAIGMILAKRFHEKKLDLLNLNISKLLPLSVFIYLTGLISSLFYETTLISNTIITLGLSGILLSLCRFIETGLPRLINSIKWIGAVSFPLFLLHQPLLLWGSSGFSGMTRAGVAIIILLLSFPAAWIIQKIVNKGIQSLATTGRKVISSFIFISFVLQFVLNLIYFITNNDFIYKADIVIFIVNIFFVPLTFILKKGYAGHHITSLAVILIPSSVLFLFVLTKNWFSIFWIFIIVLLVVHFVLTSNTDNFLRRFVIPYTITITLFLIAETLLYKFFPVEVNKWGELPVLQKDPETVYSLVPDKRTRLRYNNYDYFVNTNSLGFNGPRVNLSQPDNEDFRILITGDAFTMPEGMGYESAYPELLRKKLRDEYPGLNVKILNAAVTGYGPNEMLATLRKYIDTIKPDIIINQIFINEFSEINIEPEHRLNSIGLLDLPPRERLFSGFRLPLLISHYFHKFLNDKHFRLYTYNKSLVYYYETNSKYYSAENLNKLKAYFTKIKELCDGYGCESLILYAPGQMEISAPGQISYFPHHLPLNDTLQYNLELPRNIFRQLCSETQIPFLDPTPALKENTKQPVYFTGSWHWNREGHKVIADFLEPYIKQLLN